MRVANASIFSNGDMSGNLVSDPFTIDQAFGFSAQFLFTGSPVGVLEIQASCDPFTSVTASSPVNWTLLEGSQASISAAGDVLYTVSESNYSWIRFVYAATSGSGSINGQLNTKGF